MGDRRMRIERLEKLAIEEELVTQSSSNKDVSLKDQRRAEFLRRRIEELNRRLVRLKAARGEE